MVLVRIPYGTGVLVRIPYGTGVLVRIPYGTGTPVPMGHGTGVLVRIPYGTGILVVKMHTLQQNRYISGGWRKVGQIKLFRDLRYNPM